VADATVVGMAPEAQDGDTRGAVLTAPPPQLQEQQADRTTPRLARTQGRPDVAPGGPRRRSERFLKPVAALISVTIVLFLVGGGAYLASREYFFIGTNSDGIVTIFRGFPYSLPLGINMYEQFYVSGVPVSAIPADRRSTLLNHRLRSQGNAITLVHSAELGQLSQ
jgi:protein phosphatase